MEAAGSLLQSRQVPSCADYGWVDQSHHSPPPAVPPSQHPLSAERPTWLTDHRTVPRSRQMLLKIVTASLDCGRGKGSKCPGHLQEWKAQGGAAILCRTSSHPTALRPGPGRAMPGKHGAQGHLCCLLCAHGAGTACTVPTPRARGTSRGMSSLPLGRLSPIGLSQGCNVPPISPVWL